jgi:hypothetical protein
VFLKCLADDDGRHGMWHVIRHKSLNQHLTRPTTDKKQHTTRRIHAPTSHPPPKNLSAHDPRAPHTTRYLLALQPSS